MTDRLFFSRDTRVFVRLNDQPSGAVAWEIPVLEGFSFSQATNTTEVTLNEMADSSGESRRGRQAFNDSYAPAEWSFSTYVRPFNTGGKDQSVEQVLWALIAGKPVYKSADKSFLSESASGTAYIAQDGNLQKIDFEQSNKVTLGTADIWFVIGDTSDNQVGTASSSLVAYKIEDCVVNEATFDFDLEGIATIQWSGFGQIIKEVNTFVGTTAPTSGATKNDDIFLDTGKDAYSASSIAISLSSNMSTTAAKLHPTVTGIDTDTNYIRNRLSYLSASSQNTGGTASIVLTGGNITITNNITYVTPETLGEVNQPLGHVTGTRSVGGSITCYLNAADDSSADLFTDVIGETDEVTNNFNLTFSIGGGIAEGHSATGNIPAVEFKMANCHLEVPTHSLEDVVSLETNFHALPSTIVGKDELVISYAD